MGPVLALAAQSHAGFEVLEAHGLATAQIGDGPVILDEDWSMPLEVSAFGSAAPAEMVANQLRSGGHAVKVRQFSDPKGQTIWRVEVGNFDSMKKAGVFQRQFERTAGYSTVMIPIP